ncbi:Heat shock protein 90-6, mitochondrial, partial [Cucurbita argyrosperma subsp. sororia]
MNRRIRMPGMIWKILTVEGRSAASDRPYRRRTPINWHHGDALSLLFLALVELYRRNAASALAPATHASVLTNTVGEIDASDASATPPVENYEYQAEVSRLMDLIVNSLYSNKEAFLLELISNASDALDKLRFLSVTGPGLLKEAIDFHICIHSDKDNGIISITDTGIGMTRQELVDCLGTIAQSSLSKYWDWELTNETQPIWLRNPKEVSTEEYNEFYRKTSNEYLDPLASSHFTTEGEVEFRSILYVPAVSPTGKDDLINPKTKNIRLYVKRVFISDDFDGELAQTVGDASSLDFMRSRRVVDVNPEHQIIKNLDAAYKSNPNDEDALRAIDLLYDAALVSSGFTPENPAQLGGKIYEMMGMALSGKWSAPQSQPLEAEIVEPVEAGSQKLKESNPNHGC